MEKMKKVLQQTIQWFKASNRWKHLCGGLAIGAAAIGWYCAIYTGVCVGGALELKDKLYGQKPDWIDFAITVAGAALGQLIQTIVI